MKKKEVDSHSLSFQSKGVQFMHEYWSLMSYLILGNRSCAKLLGVRNVVGN